MVNNDRLGYNDIMAIPSIKGSCEMTPKLLVGEGGREWKIPLCLGSVALALLPWFESQQDRLIFCSLSITKARLCYAHRCFPRSLLFDFDDRSNQSSVLLRKCWEWVRVVLAVSMATDSAWGAAVDVDSVLSNNRWRIDWRRGPRQTTRVHSFDTVASITGVRTRSLLRTMLKGVFS